MTRTRARHLRRRSAPALTIATVAITTVAIASFATTTATGQEIDRALLRTHYERVEGELRAKTPAHLNAAQRAERARLLDVLRAYRLRGDSGLNERFPGERKPFFVDDDGRRCAVANLMDHSGFEKLTLEVAKTANHAWIAELASNTELARWLRASGLTLAEAARIQGCGCRSWRYTPPPPPPAWIRRTRDGAPTPTTDDGRPRPGRDPRIDTPPGTDGPRGGRASRGVRSTPGAGRLARRTLEEAITWQNWWRVAKHEFLRPQQLIDVNGRDAGTQPEPKFLTSRRELRKRVLPILRSALKDSSDDVRSSAARALGKLGDDSDIPGLKAMFSDPHPGIRNDAVLAIGALGSRRAVFTLLDLLRSESDDAGMATRKALAIVALGLARSYGSKSDAGATVASLLRSKSSKLSEATLTGAMHYQRLAPNPELETIAQSIAKLPSLDSVHALEAPHASPTKASIATLTRALNGRRQDRRQAAAVALGHIDHALALPPLMTAYEMERDPITKGILAISLGRHGGSEARKLLLSELKKGARTRRVWAAFGLALLAREKPSSKVREALRRARKKERNREAFAASLLASGIARDLESIPHFVHELRTGESALIRTAAADALVMVGGHGARGALIESLEKRENAKLKAHIATILGYFGNRDDAPLITKLLASTKHVRLRSALARSLGYLGNTNACRQLEAIISKPSESGYLRAAAIDGLTVTLTKRPSFGLAKLVSTCSFAEVPEWIEDYLWTSL